MNFDDDDSPLEPELIDAARAWRHPPDTPRDRIWHEVQRRRQVRRQGRPWLRLLSIPIGIAALLALGVALGRWSATHQAQPAGAPLAAIPTSDNAAIMTATTEHLSRSETFLTEFRAASRHGADPARFVGTSRDLLVQTRLLLDAPSLKDRRMRGLLEDLEVILVQIAQLQGERRPGDVDLITDGLNQRGVLPRLRTAIPAGAGAPARLTGES
ncbi:MAG: hypothetical protein ACHQ2E_03150 [Gemmatimonadales bacterium]